MYSNSVFKMYLLNFETTQNFADIRICKQTSLTMFVFVFLVFNDLRLFNIPPYNNRIFKINVNC